MLEEPHDIQNGYVNHPCGTSVELERNESLGGNTTQDMSNDIINCIPETQYSSPIGNKDIVYVAILA